MMNANLMNQTFKIMKQLKQKIIAGLVIAAIALPFMLISKSCKAQSKDSTKWEYIEVFPDVSFKGNFIRFAIDDAGASINLQYLVVDNTIQSKDRFRRFSSFAQLWNKLGQLGFELILRLERSSPAAITMFGVDPVQGVYIFKRKL